MARKIKARRPKNKASGQQWPAAKIEHWALERLVPYEHNARTHSPKQIDQIVASMKKWGWTTPVLIDEDGVILAGHGRVAAAQKMGHPGRVPVMVARGWSEESKRAYRLADNQLTLASDWDREMLSMELSELNADDIGLLGFSDSELSRLMPDANAAAPQLPDNLAYAVIIRCADEKDQHALLARFSGEGLRCEALIS